MAGRQLGAWHFSLARPPGELPHPPVVDVVDDGLSDEAIATQFTEWMAELESVVPVELTVTAADELHRAHAENDVDDIARRRRPIGGCTRLTRPALLRQT